MNKKCSGQQEAKKEDVFKTLSDEQLNQVSGGVGDLVADNTHEDLSQRLMGLSDERKATANRPFKGDMTAFN